ncbi:Transmembrane protein 97 [Tetrabaena socialis]|uniref:Transmembrane protein 97 n=1 Tax=Tetrabaena socialis TaxID=47790 RepID=A0A2J7ZRN6_9CHLO|nr:Transmembrane protein 97 [Tetrabaena socialis]|eukprot:PNH02925.1 Transmembrane protein 97 [Tetrabaena socialis]
MGLLGVLDAVFLAYFIIHIPTTIIVDSQSIVPAQYFPVWAKELLQWHIKTNEDHLVSTNPVWFVSLVTCETLLQLPFFFVVAYGFIRRANWIRVPCIIYGTHVATTMVPILADILFGPDSGPKRLTLFWIYFPYLLVPLLLVLRMALVDKPFAAAAGRRSGKGKRKAN